MHEEEYPEATRDLIERIRSGRLTRAEWRDQRDDREAIRQILEDHQPKGTTDVR